MLRVNDYHKFYLKKYVGVELGIVRIIGLMFLSSKNS